MSPPPPFTNISLAGSWSIITRETWDNHSKSLQIGLMRRGEPYGLSSPPCPEPCHYCHVDDRCRDRTRTNSIISSVNCSHRQPGWHYSTPTSSHQNCKESQESRDLCHIGLLHILRDFSPAQLSQLEDFLLLVILFFVSDWALCLTDNLLMFGLVLIFDFWFWFRAVQSGL